MFARNPEIVVSKPRHVNDVEKLTQLKPIHELMILETIKNPKIRIADLVELTGYHKIWISNIINSLIYKETFAKRLYQALSEKDRNDIRKNMKKMLIQGTNLLIEKMDSTEDNISMKAAISSVNIALRGDDAVKLFINNGGRRKADKNV